MSKEITPVFTPVFTPVLTPVLAMKNKHQRDVRIRFFEKNHIYVIDSDPKLKYTSVTTWIHQHFEQFDSDKIISKMMSGKNWNEKHKYWGRTSEEIKKQWEENKNIACQEGTSLHFQIECFYNNDEINFNYTNKELLEHYFSQIEGANLLKKPVEWQYFINFVKDYPNLKPYRTEWNIFSEEMKISGSVDMVYENSDGSLSIYDWKRCKQIVDFNFFNKMGLSPSICHLPDSNFWHYALQLNTYKHILETKYNKVIKELYLVKLHPNVKNYELIKLPFLTTEINDLSDEKKISELNDMLINLTTD